MTPVNTFLTELTSYYKIGNHRAPSGRERGMLANAVSALISPYFTEEYSRDCQELERAIHFNNRVLPTLSPDTNRKLSTIVDKHIKVLEARCGASIDMATATAAIIALAVVIFAAIAFGGQLGLVLGAALGIPVELALIIGAGIVADESAEDRRNIYSLLEYMKEDVLKLQQQEQHRQNFGWVSSWV